MKTEKTDILSEISTLTRVIEEQYPELQKYLDESRSTLPQEAVKSNTLEISMLTDYRDSLKALIQSYDKQKQ
ncbi:MAG: hypothetical protein HKO01_03025 [Flaviramulus sp.]|nr:hypothetical protein [Flaviramulus sp.]NNC49488.1 hypothetical protein [Flaviramulus sp.]